MKKRVYRERYYGNKTEEKEAGTKLTNTTNNTKKKNKKKSDK